MVVFKDEDNFVVFIQTWRENNHLHRYGRIKFL